VPNAHEKVKRSFNFGTKARLRRISSSPHHFRNVDGVARTLESAREFFTPSNGEYASTRVRQHSFRGKSLPPLFAESFQQASAPRRTMPELLSHPHARVQHHYLSSATPCGTLFTSSISQFFIILAVAAIVRPLLEADSRYRGLSSSLAIPPPPRCLFSSR